jgi:hypothetical protein
MKYPASQSQTGQFQVSQCVDPVLQLSVDRLDRPVGCSDADVRQDVLPSEPQCRPSCTGSSTPLGSPVRRVLISRVITFLPSGLHGCEYATMTSWYNPQVTCNAT